MALATLNNEITTNATNANTIFFTPEYAEQIMNMIMSGKAIIIVPNENNIFKFPVSETTATEIEAKKKKHNTWNAEKYYTNRLNKILAENNVVLKIEKKGTMQGTICPKTYKRLLKGMMKYKTTATVKKTFEILSKANMASEKRGLKHDIVMDVYNRLPKKHGCYGNKEYINSIEGKIIKGLVELPLTNDFPEKMDRHMERIIHSDTIMETLEMI